jgi:predicted RNA binding protein YcfA (HicA-like mRNA interferase family)
MSGRLPAIKPRVVIQALKRAGFDVHHVSGSHYVFKHPDKPGLRVTVPYHNRDLKRRTLASIIDQAGLTQEEFADFL